MKNNIKVETIKDKISRFYNLFSTNNEEGGPKTRYKSWEWCHKAFLEKKEEYPKSKNKNEIIEFLSLHLAFYLASWGMYRGSSFLLQRDYKVHKNVVKEILDSKYETLWNYKPEEGTIAHAKDLLFDKTEGIYYKIKKYYEPDEASETLVTKILMGTFGCVPAFDRFLKEGISVYKKNYGNKISNYKLNKTIEDKNSSTFMALAKLAIENEKDFRIEGDFYYPPMKCVDMYLWEIGYELDIAYGLSDKKNSIKKKEELLKVAIDLELCAQNSNPNQASQIIKDKNIGQL